MRLFFVLCLVCSAVAVTAPPITEAEVVVPLTARLPLEADQVTPVELVVPTAPTASPTPAATPRARTAAAPVRSAAPKAAVKKAATAKPTPEPTPKPTPEPTPKPTAKPTPKPSPTASPSSSRTYTREEVKAAIRSTWGGNDEEAIAVADCESGLNPRATSPSGHLGLWQMHPDTWRAYGGSGDPRDHSPSEQTAVAWRLYSKRGWAPWGGCAP